MSSPAPGVLLPELGKARVVSSPVPVTEPAPPKPRVILYAEDIDELRDLFVAFLTLKGYRVYAACDGQEAVDMALDVRPDVALLNNLMPRMSGIDACRIISAMPALDGLPIVVFSACYLEKFRPAALDAGACACWQTPFHAEDLLRRLSRVLRGEGLDPERRRRSC